MSTKRIIFAVLCALLVLVLITTGVTVVKLVQLFNSPDPTEPSETEPSVSDSTAATDPSTDPSTAPSTEATTPPTTQPTVPPTTRPTEPTGNGHTHSFNTVLSSQAPTCTDSGFKELQCACGETHWEVVDKLEHSYGYGETIPVTCESDGCTRFTCSACGYVDDRNVVLATGHAYDGGVFHAATCTEDAYTEYTCANANCPEKTKKEVQEGTKLDHNFGAWIETDGVLTKTCSRCKITQTTDDMKITENMFRDAPDNAFRVYELYVGTEHDPHMHHYKIQDCINNGTVSFSYDYDVGLTIKYKDDFGKQHEEVLSATGAQYTIDDITEPDPDPSQPEDSEPSDPSGSSEPTESTGTSEPNE